MSLNLKVAAQREEIERLQTKVKRLNDFVQENQRLSERLEQQWAENGRLRAALTEIMDLDHYPDATIARKALDEQAIHKSAGVCIARDEQIGDKT